MDIKMKHRARAQSDAIGARAALVLCAARATGVAPAGRARVTASRALVLATYCVWIFYSFNLGNFTLKSGKTTRILKLARASTTFLITFIATFFSSYRTKNWIEIIKRVEAVKSKLDIDAKPDAVQRKEILFIVAIIVNVVLLYGIYFYIHLSHTDTYVLKWYIATNVTSGLTYMISLTVELQLVFVCQLINSAFPPFNKNLHQLLQHIENKIGTEVDVPEEGSVTATESPHPVSVTPSSISRVVDTMGSLPVTINDSESADFGRCQQLNIRELTSIYAEMYDIVEFFNTCDGVPMLLLIASNAVQFILSFYFLTVMYGHMRDINVLSILLTVSWTLHHCLNTYLIINPGHRIIQENLQIQRTVDKLIGKVLACTDEFAVELKTLFVRAMLARPTLSPLRMCTLSRRLFVSISGVAASYLIIALQFQSSETPALAADTRTPSPH